MHLDLHEILSTIHLYKNLKNNEFIRCFHQFVSLIFFHEFFSVGTVEKENRLLIGSKQVFFSQFDSWKRNHNKHSLKKFVDLEFEIGESIWWTTP